MPVTVPAERMRIERLQTQHEIQRETIEFCSPAFSFGPGHSLSTHLRQQATGEDSMSAPPTITASLSNTEIDALKTRLKATWMDGNYDLFSRFMEVSAYQFLDRLDIDPESSLLDVACGSGQVALIAARRGYKVAGVDIATNAIRAARARATLERLEARFDEGDAEALPYDVGSFDVVVSLFGVMFAPQPELVTTELLRVCRPGGTVALGNWTKEGFIGQMFKTFARFIAPPGMPSPVLWGDENTVRERLGGHVAELRLTRVNYQFDYPFSPADVVEFFRQNYGPTTRAFSALGEAERAVLREALVALWTSHNQSDDPKRTVVNAEYLEVVAVSHSNTRSPDEMEEML
jgi:SAM-dependent methyltransferase